ncbi:MAG: hypothetical protein WD009_06415 [Phycisphaeraceae bacterium]
MSNAKAILSRVQAVTDAGGPQAFATEVLAEAHTATGTRPDEVSIYGDNGELQQRFEDALLAIISRRIMNDAVAERERQLKSRVTSGRYYSDEKLDRIIEKARQAALKRADKWVGAIFDEIGRMHLAGLREKGKDAGDQHSTTHD